MVQVAGRYNFLLGHTGRRRQRTGHIHIHVHEKPSNAFQFAHCQLGVFRFLSDVLHVPANGLELSIRDMGVWYVVVVFVIDILILRFFFFFLFFCPTGPFACELYGMVGSLFGVTSIWTMVFIALDRYNVIVKVNRLFWVFQR